MARFNPDDSFVVEGRRLNKLAEISKLLNDSRPITFDQRRDAANMIDLVLSEAVKVKGWNGGET